jgi:hypothetical protein
MMMTNNTLIKRKENRVNILYIPITSKSHARNIYTEHLQVAPHIYFFRVAQEIYTKQKYFFSIAGITT